jgi:tRNA(fMet)-specific endonuclease VapC
MTICDPKTLSPRYLSDTAATAVSSLSIPLSTLTEIERRIVYRQQQTRDFFALGNSRPPGQSSWFVRGRARRFDCPDEARIGSLGVQERRPLRRQSDDHHFGLLLVLTVTAGPLLHKSAFCLPLRYGPPSMSRAFAASLVERQKSDGFSLCRREEEKLAVHFRPLEPKPWMKLAGCAARDPEMIAELQRLEAIIEEEFEQIDEDEWNLDSNAISDWWQGRPALLAVLEKAAAVYLPVPVLAEFRFGILKSNRRAQMEVWFEDAKRLTSILTADAQTAECYAQIRHTLETQGRRIPMNDLWIAAPTAHPFPGHPFRRRGKPRTGFLVTPMALQSARTVLYQSVTADRDRVGEGNHLANWGRRRLFQISAPGDRQGAALHARVA